MCHMHVCMSLNELIPLATYVSLCLYLHVCYSANKIIYCILRGRIKGYNSSITTNDNELAVISAVIVIAHFFTDSHIFFYALFGNQIKSGEGPSLTTSSVATSFARVVGNSVGGYLAISCYFRGYLVEVPFIFWCKLSATVGRVKFQPSASCFVTNEVLRGF